MRCTGLTARGITAFQSAGWFGYYGYPASAQPWQNRTLWDWSRCCSSDVTKNKFFGLLGALFGYTVRSLFASFRSVLLAPAPGYVSMP